MDVGAWAGAPRHGFQGDRGAVRPARQAPLGLSVAISREAGARGGTIARLVGRKLGWQVYDQELLEYTSQNPVIRQGLADGLPPACAEWLQRRLAELAPGAEVAQLARVVLALGAQGQVVLIGRGAGCILPAQTTLNVRIVAPLPERIAYMGQWLRLSTAEAAERVRQRDERRGEFVTRHFGRAPGEVHQYALVLNSSLLGEDGCAELVVQAARLRWGLVAEVEQG
jgi:cytidylate kinase